MHRAVTCLGLPYLSQTCGPHPRGGDAIVMAAAAEVAVPAAAAETVLVEMLLLEILLLDRDILLLCLLWLPSVLMWRPLGGGMVVDRSIFTVSRR